MQKIINCGLCGERTVLFNDDRDMYRAVTYPMSEKWEIIHGCVNVAIHLDCDHYLLDDKDDDVPDFVKELE